MISPFVVGNFNSYSELSSRLDCLYCLMPLEGVLSGDCFWHSKVGAKRSAGISFVCKVVKCFVKSRKSQNSNFENSSTLERCKGRTCVNASIDFWRPTWD